MRDDNHSDGDATGDSDASGGGGRNSTDRNVNETNDGQQFDRLPETANERVVPGRATRQEVLSWWNERFGLDPSVFAEYTFFEKGRGKIWIFAGNAGDPVRIEALGMVCLRTRQEHWKPTTRAVSRFGRHATRNVISLEPEEAIRFAAGEDQDVERWNGEWGYLIAAHDFAGGPEPIGVGLYLHDELRSLIPKGSRERLGEAQ